MSIGEVYLDGEKVDFQGSAPGSAAAVWDLLEGYLAGLGRSIARVDVDGGAWQPDMPDTSFARIEVYSESLEERLALLATDWVSSRSATVEAMNRLAGFVLCHGWNQAQNRAVDDIRGLSGMLEGLEVLSSYGVERQRPWADEVNQARGACSVALSELMDALERRDCVELSEVLARRFAPAVERCLDRIEILVLPDLQEGAQ